MLRIIAINVEKKLKKAIQGEITCHIVGDALICDIFSHGIAYRYVQTEMTQATQYGLNSDIIAYTIVEAYKKFITKYFFK